jgi:large subunit ribosomal protein L18
MARGPRYHVPFRRRREGKTNYRRRLKLLYSRKPRMVVRKSNRYITVQLIVPGEDGDLTLVSAISSDLKRYGYEGGMVNMPAAYLTGLLFGLKCKKYNEAVLDIGLYSPSSRLYAVLKGALDAGLEVPCDASIFPSNERIKGEHISENYANHFESVKNSIMMESD